MDDKIKIESGGYSIITSGSTPYGAIISGNTFIGGGYSCSIDTSSFSHSIIGGSKSVFNNYTNNYGNIISHDELPRNGVNGDEEVDQWFIEESLKRPEQTILKYSPRDFKWKTYNNGEYNKVDTITFNGCKAKSETFTVFGKVIGVFITDSNEFEFVDGNYTISCVK